MIEQGKHSRDEVLKEFNLTDDILSSYETELELVTEPASGGLESFTKEDLESIRLLHKLRESGLTYNEIKLLTSFAGIIKNVDIDKDNEIKSLLSLSPTYRLKQSLNLARQELNDLRIKAKELENTLKKLTDASSLAGGKDILTIQTELDAKEKSFNALDRKLSETLLQKAELEAELLIYKEVKNGQLKSKKTKELYKTILEKDLEITEAKKKIDNLLTKLQVSEEESQEHRERFELMEEDIAEMEHEVEEKYQEQITGLRTQIEELITKKQKEWELFYTQASEQHKTELLTLQRKHEQDILRLKRKIKEQIEEIELLKTQRNPLLGLLKIGAGLR